MMFFKKLIRKLTKSKDEIMILTEEDKLKLKHKKACDILGTERFGCEYDETLDEMILDLLEKEIVSVDNYDSDFYIFIKTDDDFEYKLWDSNKYYSWLSRGNISLNGKELVSWDDVQPSAITMVKLKQRIDPLIVVPPPPSKIKVSNTYHDLVTKRKNMSTLINKL